MGGKRAGKGKYLHLCTAVLTALAFAGCATPSPPVPKCVPEPPAAVRQEYRHLERVHALIAKGDFEGGVRASQEAISEYPQGRADAALFDIALIHAHYANPRKDYTRALGAFSRLVKEYPDSPLVDEARVWVGVLEALEKAKRVDIEIEQKLKGIGK